MESLNSPYSFPCHPSWLADKSKETPAIPTNTGKMEFNELCIKRSQRQTQGLHTENQHTQPHTIPPPAEDRDYCITCLPPGVKNWKIYTSWEAMAQDKGSWSLFSFVCLLISQANYYLQVLFLGLAIEAWCITFRATFLLKKKKNVCYLFLTALGLSRGMQALHGAQASR